MVGTVGDLAQHSTVISLIDLVYLPRGCTRARVAWRRRSTADCQDFNRHLIKVSARSPKHVFIFISYRKRAFRWNVNFSCLVMTASWSKGEILWSGAESQSPGKSNDHRTKISLLRTSINLRSLPSPSLPLSLLFFIFLFIYFFIRNHSVFSSPLFNITSLSTPCVHSLPRRVGKRVLGEILTERA